MAVQVLISLGLQPTPLKTRIVRSLTHGLSLSEDPFSTASDLPGPGLEAELGCHDMVAWAGCVNQGGQKGILV